MNDSSQALRDMLRSTADWEPALTRTLEVLKERMGDAGSAGKAFELARFLEHCSLDRSIAVAGYVLCFRSDPERLDALSRARHLANELGDFPTTAKLARLQHKSAGDPMLLLAAGNAWIDAGDPDRAIKPLSVAARKVPNSEDIAAALRTARREWSNVRQEVERLKNTAKTEPDSAKASDALVQAARTLMMLGSEASLIEAYLLAALQRDHENLTALGLLEGRLVQLRDPGALMEVYERRIASRAQARDRVEEMRRAGTRLAKSPQHRALGIRLIHRAVDLAYSQGLSEIPGHIAMLAFLHSYAQEAGLLVDFLEIVNRGLSLSLPELDILYLSLRGLEVSWRELGDLNAAREYAAIANELGPGHPLVIAARGEGLAAEPDLDYDSGPIAPPFGPGEGASDTAFLDELALAAPAPMVGAQDSLREQFAALDSVPVGGPPPAEAPSNLDLMPPLDLGGEAAPLHLPEDEPLHLDAQAPLHLEDEAPLQLEDQALLHLEDDAPLAMVDLGGGDDESDDGLDMVDLDGGDGEATVVAAGDEIPLMDMDMVELDDAEEEQASMPLPSPPPPPATPPPLPTPPPPPPVPVVKPAPTEGKDPPAALGRMSLIPQSALAALKRSAAQRSKEAGTPSDQLSMPINVEFLHAGETRSALVRELGENGALLVTRLDLLPNQRLELDLQMPVDAGSLRSESMRVSATVSKALGKGFRVEFSQPPADFIDRLQSLLAQR